MWGTPACGGEYPLTDRFIPTHVGNTPHRYCRSSPYSVHPHACGEHSQSLADWSTRFGSSPRMWGTQLGLAPQAGPQRFIPTHVGNTRIACAPSKTAAVHPHACGEHVVMSIIIHSCLRFIPTHVGNTSIPLPKKPHVAVHPHACGEHPLPRHYSVALFGSSPRMWGTREHHEFVCEYHAVHPHACGEHT